jgi:TPR repeat protein
LKGRNIFTGSGVDKDLDAAKKWFTLAANQGDTDAQKTLEKFFKR